MAELEPFGLAAGALLGTSSGIGVLCLSKARSRGIEGCLFLIYNLSVGSNLV